MAVGSLVRLCIAAVSSLIAISTFAVPDLDDYGALPAISNMALSPDGKLLAFKKNDGKNEIVAVTSIVDGKFIQGLNTSDIKVRDLYFFSESKLVSVATEHKRVLGFRDSFDVSTAFLLDLPSGRIEQLLTPGDVIFTGQTGLGRIVGTSDDAKHVFMPAYARDTRRDAPPNYSLLKVDLDSPKRPAVVTKGSNYTRDYFMDGKGNLLAEVRYNSRTSMHTITSHQGDKAVEIFSQKVDIPEIGVVGMVQDGSSLVIGEESDELRRGALRAMSLSDGKLSEPVFARGDADVDAIITDINRTVFGVIYSGLRPSYAFFDKEVQGRVENILAAYPQHAVWLVDWSDDWQHLLVKVEGQTTSGSYFLFSKGQKPRLLANSRPEIKPEHINPVLEVSYKARDGLNIPALLTVPIERVDSLRDLPAVMLPHGGPAAHDWLGFDWMAQAFASRGYLVIQPQFRGSSGFGMDHWRAGHGQWGKAMQDDLTDGIESLVKQNLIDQKRICIVGGSYGGYAALAGGALTPDLYQCVASINGVSDLNAMLADTKSSHGREHYLVRYWQKSIADSKAGSRELRSISPAALAENFKAPVLLLHGKDDTVVKFDQSRRMEKSLKKAKKSVRMIRLDGEDHFLSRASTRQQTLKELIAFVDEHLKADTK